MLIFGRDGQIGRMKLAKIEYLKVKMKDNFLNSYIMIEDIKIRMVYS